MTWHSWDSTFKPVKYVRLAIYGALLAGCFAGVQTPILPTVFGQGPKETLDESRAATGEARTGTSATGDPATGTAPTTRGSATKVPDSLWEMYVASGIIGYIITVLSVIALGFIVEHFMTIRKAMLMPDHAVEELDKMVQQGQLDEALAFCQQPENVSMFSHVVLAGIERYRRSEFGFAEYKAAVEEEGEEQTSRLYRKTEVLGVIGAIAPMLGLLGTVQGMIMGFNMIATTGGTAKPEDLASSISLALVTTFEGLVVAIPAMVAYSFFRNRIDSLVAEAGKRVEQILTPLGRRRS